VLEFHITCDLTPQQVHDIGLKEVTRIRERMKEVGEYNSVLCEVLIEKEKAYMKTLIRMNTHQQ
jgi:uncharacterized protein (DUF885 family)